MRQADSHRRPGDAVRSVDHVHYGWAQTRITMRIAGGEDADR